MLIRKNNRIHSVRLSWSLRNWYPFIPPNVNTHVPHVPPSQLAFGVSHDLLKWPPPPPVVSSFPYLLTQRFGSFRLHFKPLNLRFNIPLAHSRDKFGFRPVLRGGRGEDLVLRHAPQSWWGRGGRRIRVGGLSPLAPFRQLFLAPTSATPHLAGGAGTQPPVRGGGGGPTRWSGRVVSGPGSVRGWPFAAPWKKKFGE